MRNLCTYFAVFSLAVLKNEAIEIEMDCTFDDSKSTGDWIEFGWNLIEDGLSIIPVVGDILPFLDDICDFFAGDLEGIYFNRWKTCIISWIRSEIDAGYQREASSNLNTMAITLQRLNETLEGMTSVDSEEDWFLYGPYQMELKNLANDIKSLVDAANGAATMIAPFKHAFYIELASMLLVGRRLLDMNASSTALYRWKSDSISRMQTYRDFVDHFKKTSIKPYIEDWHVELNTYESCKPQFIQQLPLPTCEIVCVGATVCQVTSSIPNINNSTYTRPCICDIWPYTQVCEGLCFESVNGCKPDFDPIRGDCEATRDDLLEKEIATKDNVNPFFEKVLTISANAENIFGTIETRGEQYEW